MATGTCVDCGREVSTTAKSCPGCGRSHPTVTRAQQAVGVLVLLLVLGAGGYFLSRSSSPGAVSAAVAARTPAHAGPKGPPTEVTAAQLWNAYEANEIAADEAYRGRLLAVTAIVGSIGKDFLDKPLLHLLAPHRREIIAPLREDQASAAALLKKQGVVTVVCTGAGRLLGDPALEDCIIR